MRTSSVANGKQGLARKGVNRMNGGQRNVSNRLWDTKKKKWDIGMLTMQQLATFNDWALKRQLQPVKGSIYFSKGLLWGKGA